MRGWPKPAIPSLRLQLYRLDALGLTKAHGAVLDRGAGLRFDFSVKPHAIAREYRCRLELRVGGRRPEAYVLQPDLQQLAGGRRPPHIYDYLNGCTRLCLFMPSSDEWTPQSWLSDTMLPWTISWLRYYELWLDTDEWEGGGKHPGQRRRRYGIAGRRAAAHV